jgi:hypothetical protein
MNETYHELLGDVRERLVRIETKLDSTSDHEGRIRILEGSKSRLLGMGAAIAGFTGIVGSQLFERITG